MRRMAGLAVALFMAVTTMALAMDGDDVCRMLRARLDERTIIRTVQSSPFRMDPAEMERIRRAGGSEHLIRSCCAASRPPVIYSVPAPMPVIIPAPVVQQPAPVVVTRPVYPDDDHTILTLINQSGRDFSAEFDHDRRRVMLRPAYSPGFRLANGTDFALSVRKGTWKIRVENYSEDGEAKARGGMRTMVRLEQINNGGMQAVVDDGERVRNHILIPPVIPVVVQPAPVVVAPPVIYRPPAPVVIQPAPVIYRPPPPVVVTPVPGFPPVIIPPYRRPPPPPPPYYRHGYRGSNNNNNKQFNFNLSF